MRSTLQGKLVFLTIHLHNWYKELNPDMSIPLVGRLAKVIKEFDWDSEEGKIILEERQKNSKWKNIDPKSFKYIINIYCPDITYKNKVGIVIPEVVPIQNPYNNQGPFFEIVPDWMLKDIVSEAEKITVIKKDKTDGR